MRWFADRSTQTKLLLSFGLVFAVLVWVVWTAGTLITEMKTRQESIVNVQLPEALDLMALNENINKMRSCVQMLLLVDDPTVFDKQVDEIKSIIEQNDQLLPKLKARSVGDTKTIACLNEVSTFLQEYRGARGDSLFQKFAAARKNDSQKTELLRQQRNGFKRIHSLLAEVGDLSLTGIKQQIQLSATKADESLKPFPFICFASIIIASALVVMLNRMLAHPLRQLTIISQEIVDGSNAFSSSGLDLLRKDEVGSLTRAFLTMSTTMLSNLSGAVDQVNEAVAVLGTCVHQIMDSVSDTASGAAQTSSAVSETTTTVQEVKQTALVASQKAQRVADSAQTSAKISQAGKEATEQTIEGVNRIREQMKNIREKMGQLAEKTKAIGEINQTVDQLAKQAKILSINAAIEAVKAGEHGTGFAVVVEEVQQMSTESKQATARVRAILHEIYAASEMAVRSIEAGIQEVELVSKQAGQASESIEKLASGVSDSAVAAVQIAISAQEQLVGVDQVATAMNGIKEATYQHVMTIHRVETAAQDLETLSSRLRQLLARVKGVQSGPELLQSDPVLWN